MNANATALFGRTPRPLRTSGTSGARSVDVMRVLSPHPAAGPAPVRVEAQASRRGAALELVYRVAGDLDGVTWPDLEEPSRANELWRTTCFEAFVRADLPEGPDGLYSPATLVGSHASRGYVELNLSPSRRWAAYAFDGYREGMRDLGLAAPPRIEVARSEGRLELTAVVDLSGALSPDTAWRVALSAVIEDTDGRIAYLALAHAPDRPDFHHPDSFVLELTANA